jgi:hypothetical protein
MRRGWAHVRLAGRHLASTGHSMPPGRSSPRFDPLVDLPRTEDRPRYDFHVNTQARSSRFSARDVPRGPKSHQGSAARRRLPIRFRQGVANEDRLIYMGAPDWPIPVRQLQGTALLELGQATMHERAFRDDMKKFPRERLVRSRSSATR